jgi:hypothetical protein
VFERVAPPLPAAQLFFKEELQHWCFAGARKLQVLFSGQGRVLVGLLFLVRSCYCLVQVFNLYIVSCNHFLVPRGGDMVAVCVLPLSLFNSLI